MRWGRGEVSRDCVPLAWGWCCGAVGESAAQCGALAETCAGGVGGRGWEARLTHSICILAYIHITYIQVLLCLQI
jgi:hypothetical protein